MPPEMLSAVLAAIGSGIIGGVIWLGNVAIPKAIDLALEKRKKELELAHSFPMEVRRQAAQKRIQALFDIMSKLESILGDALRGCMPGKSKDEHVAAVKLLNEYSELFTRNALLFSKPEIGRFLYVLSVIRQAQQDMSTSHDLLAISGRVDKARDELLESFRSEIGIV